MKTPFAMTRVAIALVAILVTACGSKPKLTYEASRIVVAEGAVQVLPFTYVPAASGEVKPDQSQTRGVARKGEQFDPDIDVYITDATAAYLAASGVRVDEAATRQVTGNIDTFALDFGGKRHEVDVFVGIEFFVSEGADTLFQYQAASEKRYKWSLGSESYGTMLGEAAQRCIQAFLVEAKAAEALSGGEVPGEEPVLFDVAP